MKKLLILIIGLTSFLPNTFANFPDYYESPNEAFHPRHSDYYDSDNEWLRRKKRADIERSSRDTVHYDNEARDYFRCDWNYNANLDTWVCDKESTYRQNTIDLNCPFGYQPNSWKTACQRVYVPPFGQLNGQGNGWNCISGYRLNSAQTGCLPTQAQYQIINQPVQVQVQPVMQTRYVVMQEPTSTPTRNPYRLPTTGGSLIFSGLMTGGWLLMRKITPIVLELKKSS